MRDFRLKGASGIVSGRAFDLGPASTLVGRSPDCDLVIDDTSVAPRHAEIRRVAPGELELLALAAGFETRVNGVSVERARLSSGDEIRLGACRWVLQAPGLRPEKVLTAAAVRRRWPRWAWLMLVLLAALAAFAWQRGAIPV